jgi:hypothetical protein
MLRLTSLSILGMQASSSGPMVQTGYEQAALLVTVADYLAHDARAEPRDPELTTIQVTANRTAFLGFRAGWQSIDFRGAHPAVTSIGTVSHVDARTAAFVQHAARWIHADVTWNFTEQRALLAANARCFGISGREAIVASGEEAFATTAWGIPYTITLDALNSMVSFDFDVLDRPNDKVVGRGTDLVHFADGTVTKIDTLRHVFEQPEWAQKQICEQ